MENCGHHWILPIIMRTYFMESNSFGTKHKYFVSCICRFWRDQESARFTTLHSLPSMSTVNLWISKLFCHFDGMMANAFFSLSAVLLPLLPSSPPPSFPPLLLIRYPRWLIESAFFSLHFCINYSKQPEERWQWIRGLVFVICVHLSISAAYCYQTNVWKVMENSNQNIDSLCLTNYLFRRSNRLISNIPVKKEKKREREKTAH